jgi:hypothetical protein
MNTPTTDLRSNIATWAVQPHAVPATVAQMLDSLQPEQFDPSFFGQYLQTTYFDTAGFALRKARAAKQSYLTLRLRAYSPSAAAGGQYPTPVFALAAKTEDTKSRTAIAPTVAKALLQEPTPDLLGQVLSPDLLARLLALIGAEPLLPAVTCTAQRYAVEDHTSRLTLDINVATDTGKHLPFNVLEFKSTHHSPAPPGRLPLAGMRPIKLSKFLWATDWR